MQLRLLLIVLASAVAQKGSNEILSESFGYGIVFGFGIGMTLITMLLVRLERRVSQARATAEQVYSAGRDNTSGLTASVLVSQWTWTATILESANSAWKFGIAGPFWYAAGSTIHIMLFAILAIEVKRKAPNMHTVTEFMLVRHGRLAHAVFFLFAVMANVLVASTLILGGAAVLNDLTGMSKNVSIFVIPASVAVYTTTGGLRATFFAGYLNSLFIFLVMLYFVFETYYVSPDIGSSQVMFKLLKDVSQLPETEDNNTFPPESAGTVTVDGLRFLGGNEDRSYVTLTSSGALVFGIINIVGNFGVVFVDQSYWQSAIAAANSATVPGFLLAGIAWFPVPFALSTSIGLACRALQLGISEEQADQGLVPAFAVSELLGQSGSVLLLIILFLATTSTGSAELISFSSLMTYDMFMEYIPRGKRLRNRLYLSSRVAWAEANNNAPYPKRLKKRNDKCQRQLLEVTMVMTLSFAVAISFFSLVLDSMGADTNFLYLSTGVWLGPAVVPIIISFMWHKANGLWCSLGALLGLALSLFVWVVYAASDQKYNGVGVESLGDDIALLVANLTAIFSGGIISVVGSRWRPDNFRWQKTIDGIKRTDEDPIFVFEDKENTLEFLNREAKRSRVQSSIWTTIFLLFPIIMYFTGYIFSSRSFELWVTTSVLWAVIGTYIGVILPIVQELKKSLIRMYANRRAKEEDESMIPLKI